MNSAVAFPLEAPVSADRVYEIPVVEPSFKPAYQAAKHLFDLVASALALLLLGIPMLFLALLIRLDSPGPALFRQERLGLDGRPFLIFKFRTMRLDAERDGPRWAEEHDPRCAKLGLLLRKSRLDELPQLFNVLRGDMSLVGPRPERQYFYDLFETYIHGFHNRLKVLPGITGWAQVNGGYSLLPEEKILYDMDYIRNRSLWMDLKCLFRTIAVLFSHEGAR